MIFVFTLPIQAVKLTSLIICISQTVQKNIVQFFVLEKKLSHDLATGKFYNSGLTELSSYHFLVKHFVHCSYQILHKH